MASRVRLLGGDHRTDTVDIATSMSARQSPAGEGGHVPVMLERCVELLRPALDRDGGAVCVDATLGLGGHTEALLRALPRLRIVGLDRDEQALTRARQRLARYAGRVEFVRSRYDDIAHVLADLGLPRVDGVLFDLGVSSLQLDTAARGFSYAHDAPLDMRMDLGGDTTAADVVNTYSAEDLARVLRDYGEERFARRIATAILAERRRSPIVSTARLAELVRTAIPAATRRTGGHPAKRTFQALRIEVNSELEALARALPAALDTLAVGGRIVVLAYHSLEDRMVKRVLAARATDSAPPGLPVVPDASAPRFRVLTRGAELPTEAETSANPRASSARLRAAERIRED